ncbi:MAG: PIN domain-containing protein [Candidatus Altiarchaeota archaeon]
MTSRYVIDSYAWIEYFKGSKAGEQAKRYIEEEVSLTPAIVLAELSDKYTRDGLDFLEDDLSFIRSKSQIIPLDGDLAHKAGLLNATMRKEVPGWGMADSIILAIGQKHNAQVVTGDKHFEKIKEAILID